MNTELLLKIADKIVKHPDGFYMEYFFGVRIPKTGYIKRLLDNSDIKLKLLTRCNTVACIGGTAILLTNREVELQSKNAIVLSSEILDLDCEQARKLFLLERWPRVFKNDYINAISVNDYMTAAEVAVKRIHHFINTNGEE